MTTRSDELLCENKFVSLRVIRDTAAGVDGYVYAHEARCAGRMVAVLPYKATQFGYRYLVRSEITPCWSIIPTLSAITGGCEGRDVRAEAVRELLEETSFAIKPDELIPLGDSFASKSSDTVFNLFSVNLAGRTAGPPSGDGTPLEARGRAVWVDKNDLTKIPDPLVALLYLRLREQLVDQFFSAGEAL
ncbi:NUDIX hydrolase [Micromonospora sp. C51]|uniref:NUDIX hydrolase n=1 Tax=Micromonospora sp. C51 TaxID=2824879 RepID=UPI001B387512|nr:NUDIX hydrolase [Micromonospora sp. C51]MBQ1047833.1 NUDIX hydrolase [Micromonospora sp. C51]